MAGGAPIRISILANSTQARRELNSFTGQLKRTVGAASVLVGAYGGVQLFKDVVTAGSEAEQSLGGVQSVFKEYASEVERSSERAAQAVGLSANEYRNSATLIGSLLKGQGVQMSALAGKTDDLVTLAGDLAATFGGDTKTAVESLTSAFKGEFNPIEKYGISLKQSTVNAKAAEVANEKFGKALKDLTAEQESAVKQQATYALIMDRSRDAQGQFARESDSLAGKQQRLNAEIANVKAELGTSLLPVMTELAQEAADHLVPALGELADWFDENVDDIASSGRSIAKGLLPPLRVAGDLALELAKAVDSIPGPVKEMAIQLLIAGKAFKVLNAGAAAGAGQFSNLLAPVTKYQESMARLNAGLAAGTISQARFDAATASTSAKLKSSLQPALSSAAGAAGMGLLLASTSQSDKALGGLLKVAGGAATGFSVGGPLGAAIGGTAGLLWGARDAFNATEGATRRAAAEAAKVQSWQQAKAAATELRDALYGTVDAYNEVTAASVKQGLFADGKKLGWVKDLEAAGVNLDTITRAVLGQRDAQALVNREFLAQDKSLAGQKARIGELTAEIKAMGQVDLGSADESEVIRLGALQDELKALKITYDEDRLAVEARKKSYGALAGTTEAQAANEKRLRTELQLTKREYDSLPEAVRTKVEAEGLPQTKQSVLDLLKLTDDLSGKQVVSMVRASGVSLARRDVEGLQKRFALTPKQVTTLLKVNGLGKAKSDAARGGRAAGSTFRESVAAGVGSGGDVREAARASVEGARVAASREAEGARGVGQQITSGFTSGIGLGEAVANAARAVIRNALKAARDEAKIKSPSRVAAKDGKNIAAGYAKGIREGWPDVLRAVRTGMDQLFDKQVNPAAQFAADLRSQVRSALSGKAERRALRVVDAYEKEIRASYKAWADNEKALTAAREKLQALKDEAASFKSSVASSVKGWFDPISAGLEKSGAWTQEGGLLASILGSAREQSAQISQTTNLLAQAVKRGLSKDAAEKILSLSPEDANRAAIALASATGDQLKELDDYYTSVNSQADAAAKQAYNSYFKVGIQAQQGIVDGLLKDKKAIERAADSLGDALVRAVKKRLGIKSPSRVFRGLGEQVTAGLELGLDVPKVGRLGRELAASLERGFDPRALSASVMVGSDRAPSTVVNLAVTAPVGSSSVDIGRELARHLRSYASVSGGRVL